MSQKYPQSITCLAFDLQKVLNVPSVENGLFYYTCKLAVYNLTITDLVTKDGFCYTWDQTTAKQGASEIGSCIYFSAKDYLKHHKCITLFSDNCPRPNKNRYIFHYLHSRCKNSKRSNCFFFRKRTHLECQWQHIFLSWTCKKGNIFHSYQWEVVMQFVWKFKPYNVKVMNKE